MVLDREAPGSHWSGLARNDLELAYLTLRVHMMNSFVVLSPFWVKHDPWGCVLANLSPLDLRDPSVYLNSSAPGQGRVAPLSCFSRRSAHGITDSAQP